VTLTELTFGLSALILGLALTHMATAFSKLLLSRKRIRWSPEPLLQAAIILLVVIAVWLSQWEMRATTTVIYWRVLVQELSYLSLFVAASVCLPQVDTNTEELNLATYYYATRRLSYGALILSIIFINVYFLSALPTFRWNWSMIGGFVYCLPYGVLMLVRRRWLNLLLLILLLIFVAIPLVSFQLK
jgi:hypothetical protein